MTIVTFITGASFFFICNFFLFIDDSLKYLIEIWQFKQPFLFLVPLFKYILCSHWSTLEWTKIFLKAQIFATLNCSESCIEFQNILFFLNPFLFKNDMRDVDYIGHNWLLNSTSRVLPVAMMVVLELFSALICFHLCSRYKLSM